MSCNLDLMMRRDFKKKSAIHADSSETVWTEFHGNPSDSCREI